MSSHKQGSCQVIIANMATFPARIDGLRDAVARIAPQVDRLNLCLNEFEEIPDWIGSCSNVHAVIPDQDLKDLGKFLFSRSDEDDVFLVDDDLDYPVDYVEKTLLRRDQLVEQTGKIHAVGYHGTIYLRNSVSWFLKDLLKGDGFGTPQLGRARIVHAYHAGLPNARIVAQLGTGTVLARGSQLPNLSYMLGAERRADVRYAKWCFQQGIAQVALPRPPGWLPRSENDDSAIYTTYTSKLPSEFLDEISEFVFAVPRLGKYLPS